MQPYFIHSTADWEYGIQCKKLGIPIVQSAGYVGKCSTNINPLHASKLSYEHFGFTWNIRMIGFGLGTLVFGLMSYLFLKEIPTLKTAICLLLALSIILIQVTNVIGE